MLILISPLAKKQIQAAQHKRETRLAKTSHIKLEHVDQTWCLNEKAQTVGVLHTQQSETDAWTPARITRLYSKWCCCISRSFGTAW